jgi:hypothetical protein
MFFPFDIGKIPQWRGDSDPTLVKILYHGTDYTVSIYIDEKIAGELPKCIILDFFSRDGFEFAFIPPIPLPMESYRFA